MNVMTAAQARPLMKISNGVIRLAGVIRESCTDGPGVRFAVFVQGCPHRCNGCHNPDTHDFAGGRETTVAHTAAEIIKSPVSGITFSGGEPFAQAAALTDVARIVRRSKKISLIVFTGYRIEELLDMAERDEGVKGLLSEADYVIDGRYEKSRRDLTAKFRGSVNQRILDVSCYPYSKKVHEVAYI